MIKSIVDAVTIPVMAKVRIGHFVEAQASPIFIVMPTRLITPPSWLN
jgi:pyridoxal 5'-phosphate synthase pdxS subunit